MGRLTKFSVSRTFFGEFKATVGKSLELIFEDQGELNAWIRDYHTNELVAGLDTMIRVIISSTVRYVKEGYTASQVLRARISLTSIHQTIRENIDYATLTNIYTEIGKIADVTAQPFNRNMLLDYVALVKDYMHTYNVTKQPKNTALTA